MVQSLLLMAALASPSPMASGSPVPASSASAALVPGPPKFTPIPCGWLIDRLRLAHGGKLPTEMPSVQFVGELYEQALALRGFTPTAKKPLKLTREQIFGAAVDIDTCFGA